MSAATLAHGRVKTTRTPILSFRLTEFAIFDYANGEWKRARPTSREMRELRLIARAERAEARLWWERFKAGGCR